MLKNTGFEEVGKKEWKKGREVRKSGVKTGQERESEVATKKKPNNG